MEGVEMKSTVSGYLEKCKCSRNRIFIDSITRAFQQGRLDHNYIRKVIISCFESHDENAVILGSLLLQLDNNEIYEFLKDEGLEYS